MRATRLLVWLAAVAMLAGLVGCTDQLATNGDASFSQTVTPLSGPSPNRIQIVDYLAGIDVDARALTFVESEYVVTVPEDCPIVAVQGGEETDLTFADLKVGDYVKVCAVVQGDIVTAHKVVVYLGGDCEGFDLIWQDSIATIDYAAGTFTVYGRDETITIDANTVIWGKIPYQNGTGNEGYVEKDPANNGSFKDDGGDQFRLRERNAVDTIYAFTDLQPGWVLEIKANIVDENTLAAFDIKVLGCNYQHAESFTDYLVAVDLDNSVVTFQTEAWIGSVCQGASLLDAEGNELTLADFAAGDYVAVKGVALTDDTLRVCELVKQ